ncbi:MAG: SLC13 family permease [Pirellulales bacterium]|nr:SLC13 family permease [Pirellulales bacterium]
MSFPLIITLVVLAGLIAALAIDKWPTELVMLSALLVFVCAQIVPLKDALAGFSNSAVLTIGALFVVGSGLQATGAVEFLSRVLLGRPKKGTPLMRLVAPVAGLSSFMNNTPVVAFFLPVFVHIARKIQVSPSKLLIPLSYASILGGTCTLIGTSTNFVVDGAIRAEKMPGLGMWELAPVGVPVTIVGLIYLATIGQRLLPSRTDLLEYAEAHPREYTLELIVRPECPLVGKTVRRSGLRDLPGLYVYGIERGAERMSPASPEERIKVGDILCFSGIVGTIVDAQKIRGLEPVDHAAADDGDELAMSGLAERAVPRSGLQLCEVVISPASPLIGHSVKEANFRGQYGAPIIAVHRSGEKLEQKIGQIVLQPGDTLLVDAPNDFVKRWRNSRDFILVSGLEDSAPIIHHKAWISLSLFLAVVVGMTAFTEQATLVAMIGATLTVLTGCLAPRDAHRAVELPVLLLIASALGVSQALDRSGAAEWIAGTLLSWAQPYGKVAVLAVIVVMTGLLTELLSNNACAALMSVLTLAAAKQMGMDPRPLLIAVAVTSSYGFATPLGYQTNLMVLGPGGYRFTDYLKVGMPLDLISWTMTILVISRAWTL